MNSIIFTFPTTYVNTLKLFLVLMILILNTLVFGQRLDIHSDSIEVLGTKGAVTYTYIKNKSEKIKHQKFSFISNEIDSLSDNFIQQLVIDGSFYKNHKTEEWTFNQTKLRPTTSKGVDGYNVVQLGSGVEKQINALFNEGRATGEWISFSTIIENSKVTDTLYKSTAQFKENKFNGRVKSTMDTLKLEGNVQNNFFEGDWVFVHKGKNEAKEIRSYSNGVLIKHELVVNNKTYDIKHVGLDQSFKENDEHWENVTVTKAYFDIILETNFGKINGTRDTTLSSPVIRTSNTFLKASLASFIKHNDHYIWSIENSDTLIEYPKLRVKKFPYSKEEKEKIATALVTLKETKSIIDNFLNDPQVEVNKHSYPEIAKYYEAYTIYKRELAKLNFVFSKLSLSTYEYINREEILPYIFEGTNFPTIVKYEYEGKENEVSIDFPENLNSNQANIENLSNHLEIFKKKLLEKKEIVEPIIKRNKKRFEIADKEKKLLEKRDSIEKIFSNNWNDPKYNELHTDFKTTIIEYSMSSFKKYAQEDIDDRINHIDAILLCFSELIHFYEQLIEFKNQEIRINELYTRVVWNPYTFTDMEETVKERIYNAYSNHLKPYFYLTLKENFNCAILSNVQHELDTLFTLMRALRNQDTKDLEKSLKRKTKIEEILLEFDLQPLTNHE